MSRLADELFEELYADQEFVQDMIEREEAAMLRQMEWEAQEGEEIDLYFESVIQNQIQ